jgi:hypothetical protein
VCSPPSAGSPQGTVIGQSPTAGSAAPPGSRVTLTIELPVAVPNLVGMRDDAACAALADTRLGCKPIIVKAGTPPGTVIGQDPPAGTSVPPQTTVVIQIRQRQQVPVPDVVGSQADDACDQIKSLGLVCTPDGSGSETTVARQEPAPGALVAEGTPIKLVLTAQSRPTGPFWVIGVLAVVALVGAVAIGLSMRGKPNSPQPVAMVTVGFRIGKPIARTNQRTER